MSGKKSFEPKYFLEGPLNAAKTLRENNIPFEVIGSKNIRGEKSRRDDPLACGKYPRGGNG